MNSYSKIIILFQILFFIQVDYVMCQNKRPDDIFKDAVEVKCGNRTERKAENLMPVLLPLGTDENFPENVPELRKYCNLANKSIKFVLGFFHYCTSEFAKTLVKVMFFPINKQLKGVCRAGQPSRMAKDFMIAGKCGNLARQRLKDCNANMIDALVGIPSAPVKDRTNMVCCHSKAMQNCIREATEETVGCTRQTVDWAERFVLRAAGSAIQLACGEYYEESDKCTKLLSKTPKPKYSNSFKRPQTFFKPLIAIMESLPEI